MIPGLRERIHRRVSKGDLPFRFRGTEPTRTEALADAVIGFAITLVVVSLEVPKDSHDLLTVARGFASFAGAFVILFTTWFGHQRFCRRYGLEDDVTIGCTGAILFVVVFYTYPLKFVMSMLLDRRMGLPGPVAHREDVFWITCIYGVGLALVGALFALLYRHAWSLRDLLELDEAERYETQHAMRSYAISLVASAPLILSPVLYLFPTGTPGRKPAAIVYLVLLVACVGLFYWRLIGLHRDRGRMRARLAAAEPKEDSA